MMTTPNSPIPIQLQSLPAWLQAAVFLGVPSVIALFLVYVVTMSMAARIVAIEQAQASQMQTLQLIKMAGEARQADAEATKAHFDAGVVRIETLLRAMCVAIASTQEGRTRCTMAGQLVP
jgi:hypothetical protein